MDEPTIPETTESIRDERGRFVPGVSGNPAGRPRNSFSIKDKIRQFLEDNPQEVEEIVRHFVKENRELMWQMLEGRPQQDVTSGGEKIPLPILDVRKDDGNIQNNITPKEN